jgi:hypothetical protein
MVLAGVRWVVTALAIGFGLVAVADVYFEIRRWRSVSVRLQTWARRYPLYAGMLVFLLGALLAHFIINRDV